MLLTFTVILVILLLVLFWQFYTLKEKYVELETKWLISQNTQNVTYEKDLEFVKQSKAQIEEELKVIAKALEDEKKKNEIIIGQKKSSETRLGVVAENLIPLLGQLPYDPTNLHHLARPLDFVYFDYDLAEIIFVEVKTNRSKESKRQKILKNAIKLGKVYYEILRINEDGITIKREENEP